MCSSDLECAPLRLGPPCRLHADAEPLELALGAMAQLVVAERGQEEALSGQPCELDGGDGSTARRFLPGLGGVHDLARRGHAVYTRELDPLDVADDGDARQCKAPLAMPTSGRAGSARASV